MTTNNPLLLSNSLPVRDDVANQTVHVALGDDQKAVRGLVRQLILDASERYCVVGEAETRDEIVTLCTSHRIDLLIVDLAIQNLAFNSFLKELLQASPETRVLVFSRWSHPVMVKTCIAAGVHGVVFKSDPVELLLQAIQMISNGGMYFSPSLEMHRPSKAQGQLTEREQEALCLIAQGYSTKEMADVMAIRCKTAEKYRERIMSKLGLHDAVRLTHFAIQAGLVAP